MQWCKAVGTQPLTGLNLGTGTPEQAAALVDIATSKKEPSGAIFAESTGLRSLTT